MLIGIDWGGTKIEGVALAPDGRELLRVRQDTPRHDYPACSRVDRRADRRARAGDRPARQHRHRHPGLARAALPPRQGRQLDLAAGRPVEHDLREALSARSASRTMPTASPPRRPSTAPALGSTSCSRSSSAAASAPASPSAAGRITAPTTAPANGATIRCRSRAPARSRRALLLRQAWLPGDLGVGPGFEADYARHTGRS